MTRPSLAVAPLLLCALLAASSCDSHRDSVCQDVGDCSQGGSNDWIAACQAEAKGLQAEAAAGGCGAAFDSYFACADASYTCQGATALFPGCDDERAALDTCLAAATASTSCAALVSAQASCGGSGPDGGAGTGTGLPPACTLARDCQAQCYLAQVSNVCAPRVDELSNLSACTASCPP